MAIEIKNLTEEESQILGGIAAYMHQLRWSLPDNKFEPEGIYESWIDVLAKTFNIGKDEVENAVMNEFYLRDMARGNLTAINNYWYPKD